MWDIIIDFIYYVKEKLDIFFFCVLRSNIKNNEYNFLEVRFYFNIRKIFLIIIFFIKCSRRFYEKFEL